MSARIWTIAFGVVAASVAVGARAEEDVYSNSLRLGAYYVWYDTQADDIRGPFVPPADHLNLKVRDVITPYFAYVRRLTNHFSVELAVGGPPLTKTEGKGPAKLGSVPYNGQVITTARWLAPTLLLTYSFFGDAARFPPSIGAGVNSPRFYSRQSTAAGNAASGGPTSIDLPTSVGPAV